MTITSSKPCCLQQLDDVLHARLADDRHHRLRLVRRQRAKARALAARHDDGLHRRSAFHAVAHVEQRRDDGGARARSRRATSGQRVSVVRDDPEADRGVEQPGRGLAEQVHVEVDAARREHAPAGEQQEVARGDHDEPDPRQPAVRDEQDHRGVDHQPVGERVGDLAERATRRASGARGSRRPGRSTPATPKRIPAGQLCASPALTISDDEHRDEQRAARASARSAAARAVPGPRGWPSPTSLRRRLPSTGARGSGAVQYAVRSRGRPSGPASPDEAPGAVVARRSRAGPGPARSACPRPTR